MTFHGVFTVAPGDVKIMNVTLLVGKSESQLNVSLMKVTKAAHVDRHYEWLYTMYSTIQTQAVCKCIL